jgi:hypothetical protein
MPITSEPSPNPPPAGTARVRYIGAFDGGAWSTGLWALLTGAPLSADIADLALGAYGVFQTNFLGDCSDQLTLEECSIEYFTGGGSITGAQFASHAGAASAAAMPANSATVISWSIEETYRGGKPRMYLPFTGIDQLISPRQYGATYVASRTTQAGSFLDDFNALSATNIDTCTAGVVAFFSGGVALAPPVFRPYLAGSCQARVCTQRRRLGAEI